ncbi:unnamed protein product [Urochloa decumbens]|uniref:LysM domain-containing protein n=1 Tax=Urochloa decumbens TaxID=240449 RepID=A0ABC8VNX2_9POAL
MAPTRADRRVAVAAALLVLVAVATVHGAGANDDDDYVGREPPLGISVHCKEARAAQAGDTCDSVARAAGFASAADIMFLNPNVTCGALFPGQWVCVRGEAVG